jgi:Zn-dependent peptidase ImmA (M78 family)
MSDYKEYEGIDPEDLLLKLDMTRPPFNPFDVAKKLGIEVSEALDWKKLSYDGEIFLDDDKNPKIWINQTNHENRKRFTVAHEIGHFINDVIAHEDTFTAIFDDKDTLSFKRDGNKNFIELRANDFAARLLMPKEYVLSKGRKIITDFSEQNETKISREHLIKELAMLFQVSEEAMKWRLINLNLISH